MGLLASEHNPDRGSVDSFLIFVPVVIVVAATLTLFQYGLAVNELSRNATFIGRELARTPIGPNSFPIAKSQVVAEQTGIADFHIMRYPIGDQTFIQLVLIGKPIRFAWFTMTPSGRSLTVVDNH